MARPLLSAFSPFAVPALAACLLLLSLPTALRGQEAPPPPSQVTTLRGASATIVLEDVTVVDSHGKPVHGLTKNSFTITEDGKPQTLSSFEEHSLIPIDEVKIEPFPKLQPGVFTNYTPAPEAGAINILLLDTLNTPLAAQAYARAQALLFLKNLRPGTRMAIFVMNRELHLLQGFTSNPDLLKAALDNKRSLRSSAMLDNATSGGLAGDSTLSDNLTANDDGNDPNFASTLAALQQLEAEQTSLLLTMRTQFTLDAMNQLARYLASLPGRKNLIWFSGSFPLDLMPDGDLPDPFSAMGDSEDEFRETITLMGRSHVAVYPVDVRGLMVDPSMNVDVSNSKYAKDPKAIGKDQGKFFEQTSEEHSTMAVMAEKTGGKAYYNTNGLKQAVDDAITSGSNYYGLSYVPHTHRWDGNYHSISVKVTDPELAKAKYKLTYRVGYYADDPDGPPVKKPKEKPLLATSTPDPPPLTPKQTAMQAAMRFGAPQPTQIVMKVLVQPAASALEDSPADGNELAKKITGPFRRYTVDYAADARNIQFVANPDGTFKAVCEFAVVVYDEQGQVINTLSKTAVANMDTAHRTATLKGGMHFHQEISVPAKGLYWLRIGIHDRTSDRLGSVEVPIESVQRAALAAAKPAPTTPTTTKPNP